MKFIDLIENADGDILVAGCKLGDDANEAKMKLTQLSTWIKDTGKAITAEMSCSRTRFNQTFEDKNHGDPEFIFYYDTKEDKYFNEIKIISEIEFKISFQYGYPFLTIADFEELVDGWANSKDFKPCKFTINPVLNINEIYLEGKKCEIELVWSKRDDHKSMYIIFRITPPIYDNNGAVFNVNAAYEKNKKIMAYKLGKSVMDLTNSELDNVSYSIGIPPHDFDVP